MNHPQDNTQTEKFNEKILLIRRVSKKTTGGNYVTFSALVAVGDGQGRVGLGVGRGLEVPPAIQKAIAHAKKHLVTVPRFKSSIPHQVMLKYKAAKLLLKPAPEGTGLKVGGVTRVILDLAGVYDASGKIIGSRNQVVNAYAVMEAIKKLKHNPHAGNHTQSTEKKEIKEPKKTTQPQEEKIEKPVKTEVKEAKPKKEVKSVKSKTTKK